MRFLRFLIGLALLPLTVAAALALKDLVAPADLAGHHALWLLGGFAGWCVVWILLPKPVLLYVLGHELTHALWAHAMGAEVSDLRVSRSGGSVVVSKSNFWIALAPYFFPLYTVLLILGMGLAGLFWDLSPWAGICLAGVGATWGFHFTFTLQMLLAGQSDLRPYGTLFSLIVIFLMNTVGLGAGVVAAGPATLEDAVDRTRIRTIEAYGWSARQLHGAWEWGVSAGKAKGDIFR